jgi:hypothetical protein
MIDQFWQVRGKLNTTLAKPYFCAKIARERAPAPPNLSHTSLVDLNGYSELEYYEEMDSKLIIEKQPHCQPLHLTEHVEKNTHAWWAPMVAGLHVECWCPPPSNPGLALSRLC